MAEAPDDQSCAVCRYYVDVVGECHRYPPELEHQSGTVARLEARWPPVPADAWCGEFGKIPGSPPAIPTHKGET